MTPVALWDDAHTRIDHFPGSKQPGILVITFDPLMYLWPKPPFGLDFLQRQGVGVVAVRRKAEHFYQPLDRERFLAVLQPLLRPGLRVMAYGSSLGAYAALYYARTLDAEVLALSPRVSVHPVYGHPAWQARLAFQHQVFAPGQAVHGRVTVVYDPRDATDRRYVEGELLPAFSQARVLRVPYAGHPVSQFLGDIGFLPAYVRALVAGQALPALDRRGRRRQSATYHQVLSDHCLRHRRSAAAAVLIERSLALRPRNLLALRTRGQARAALQDWPEALASLEAALALDPADPWTQSLLKQTRRQVQASDEPASPAGALVATPATPVLATAPALAAASPTASPPVPAAPVTAAAQPNSPSGALRFGQRWARAWRRWLGQR